MSTLTFKNSRGQLVDIPAVAVMEVKKKFGAILEKAIHAGAIAITVNNSPKAVLLSYQEFESVIKGRSRTVGELSADLDGLVAQMQTPKAKQGMETAFKASPAKLGRAAVKTARKPR
jgi:prevent-host-death family protein